MEKEKKVTRIARKLQERAKKMQNESYYKDVFLICKTTEDILFEIGSDYWSAVLRGEGYSERFINQVYDYGTSFIRLFDKVVAEWERLDIELTSKLTIESIRELEKRKRLANY